MATYKCKEFDDEDWMDSLEGLDDSPVATASPSGEEMDWGVETDKKKKNSEDIATMVNEALAHRRMLTDHLLHHFPEAYSFLQAALDRIATNPTEENVVTFNECLSLFHDMIAKVPDEIATVIKREMPTTSIVLGQERVDYISRLPQTNFAFLPGAMAQVDAMCRGEDFHAETSLPLIEGQIWAFVQGRDGCVEDSVGSTEDKMTCHTQIVTIPGDPILPDDAPADLNVASSEIVKKIGCEVKKGSPLDIACRDCLKTLAFKAGGKKAKAKTKAGGGASVDKVRIDTSFRSASHVVSSIHKYLDTANVDTGFISLLDNFPRYLQRRTVEQSAIAFRIFANWFTVQNSTTIEKIARNRHNIPRMIKKLEEARFRFAVAYMRFTTEAKRTDFLYLNAFQEALLSWKESKGNDRRHRPFDAPSALVTGFTETLDAACKAFLISIGLDNPKEFMCQCLKYPKICLESPITPLITKAHKMHDVQEDTLRLFLHLKGRVHINLRAGTGSGKTTLIALIAHAITKMRETPTWDKSPKQMVVYAPNPSILAMIMGTLYYANVSFGAASYVPSRKGTLDHTATIQRQQQWKKYVDASRLARQTDWSRRMKSLYGSQFSEFDIDTGLNTKGEKAWEVRSGTTTEGIHVFIPSDRRGTNTWGGDSFEECFNGRNRVTVMIATNAKTLSSIMFQAKNPNRICLVLDDAVAVTCTDKGEDYGDITGLGIALRYCPESVIHMSATLPRKIAAFEEAYAGRHPDCTSHEVLGRSVPTGTGLFGRDGKQYVPHEHCTHPDDLITCAERVSSDPVLARFPTANVVTSLLMAWRSVSRTADYDLEGFIRTEMTSGPIYQTFWQNQYVTLLRAIAKDDVDVPTVVASSHVTGEALPTTGEGDEEDYDISEIIALNLCKGGCFIGTSTPKDIAMQDIPLAFAKLLKKEDNGIITKIITLLQPDDEEDDEVIVSSVISSLQAFKDKEESETRAYFIALLKTMSEDGTDLKTIRAKFQKMNDQETSTRIINELLDSFLSYETRMDNWILKRNNYIDTYLKRKETSGSKSSRRSGLTRDGEMGDRKADMIFRHRANAAEAFDSDSTQPKCPEDPVPRILNNGYRLPADPVTEEEFNIMAHPSVETWFKYLLGCCRIAIVYDGMPKEYEAMLYRYIESGCIRYVISDWRTAYGLDVPCSTTIRLRSFQVYGSATDLQLAGRSGRLGKESQGMGRAYMINVDEVAELLESPDPYTREGEILSRGVAEIDPMVRVIADEDEATAEVAERRIQERLEREEREKKMDAALKADRLAAERAEAERVTSLTQSASSTYVPPHLRRNARGATSSSGRFYRPKPSTKMDWESLRR